MVSNTYNRYLWLLNTLLIYKRLTFDEIKSKWEISGLYEGTSLSKRTFHVHRLAIEEMFHVSIACDTSDGYRYFIANPQVLSTDNIRKWLLDSFNVANMVAEGIQMKDRILLENIPQGTEYLSLVIKAMQENHVLEVEYKSFYHDTFSRFHIEPYGMKVYHHRWYILGLFHERHELRHIALDRVVSMQEMDVAFIYPKDFSPANYYKDVVGIWTDERRKPEEIVLRAYDLQPQYLRTLPLHESQEEINSTETYTDFKYTLCITNDLIAEILAKGNTVEVLKPQLLRGLILKRTFDIIKRYKN